MPCAGKQKDDGAAESYDNKRYSEEYSFRSGGDMAGPSGKSAGLKNSHADQQQGQIDRNANKINQGED
jgi:hypothetical protein